MGELDLKQESNIYETKTHEEILKMLEEIKDFEKKYQEYDLEQIEEAEEFIEVEKDLVEFIDVEKDTLKQIEPIPIKHDAIKPISKNKIRKKRKLKVRVRRRPEKKKAKPETKVITPATFKIRFNEGGQLVNIDLKKSKLKPKSRKHIRIRKSKIKNEEKTENEDKKSKVLKLKGGLGKIGYLKKAIPHRAKKEEEIESEKSEFEE